MKKQLIPIVFFLLSSILLSCNKTSKEEQKFDGLMQEVINVHDEVMPKMGDMSSMIRELEAKIDTTITGQAHAAAQEDLKESYDFMMEWMGDFSKKFPHGVEIKSDDKEKFAAKMEMLQKEKVEVTILKDQINTSMDNAKALLKKQ